MKENERKKSAKAVPSYEEEQRTEEILRLQSHKKERRHRRQLGGSISGVVKTFAYITLVLLLGVGLAIGAIFAANDVFALRKSDEEIVVNIPDRPDINAVAKTLADADVIRYPGLFRLYAAVRHKADKNFVGGEYTVSPSMGYDELVTAFVPHQGKREQIAVTIPEGYCCDDIIDLLVSKGIGSKEGFRKAINEESYDYWFLENVAAYEKGDERFYRLEGFLYPDTYYFYTDSGEREVIVKFLDNFGAKFRKKYVSRCEKLGMTMEDVITLASVIQAEAKYESEYVTVSSVFHNRLGSENMRYRLESDATIQYYFRHVEGKKRQKVSYEDLQVESPYNSYLREGLPVGPITNPSISAISAAMYPAETGYYYFVTSPLTGKCYFAKTYAGHQENIKKVAEEELVIGEEEDSEEAG